MNLHTSNFTDLKTVGALHSCNSYEDFAKGHQKQAMARIIKFLSPNNKTELAPNRHYDPVGDIPMRQYCALGLAMLVGSVLGAATITALQAQAKPPIYLSIWSAKLK